MKRLALSVIIILFFAGCAAPPRENIKKGSGPYPENFVQLIKCYLEDQLPNPESLKGFNVTKPPKKIIIHEHLPTIPLRKGSEVWECFFEYDYKNQNGNYVGNNLHVFWIRHNKIVALNYMSLPFEFRIKQRQGDPCAPENKT